MVDQEVKKITDNSREPCFTFQPVTEKETVNAVKAIKTNAQGVDDISAHFIKMSIDHCKTAITYIINGSIKYSYFPSRWKQALVKPIPKNNNPTVPKDFRPISLLPAFSKILERLISWQITSYMKDNKLWDKYQSAYRKHHSTTTALLDLTTDIYDAIDNSEVTILVLLDYSKAFDCANHKLILAKLQAMGFAESSLAWITSYLGNRCQQVKNDAGVSTWETLINGVPQGSILGPMFFSVLVSDLHTILKHCKHQGYADDRQLYIHGKPSMLKETIVNLNEDLSNIADYSRRNCLQLNKSKSGNFIIIGSKHNINKLKEINIPEIIMDGKEIERCTEVLNLGVTFDEILSWTKHTSNSVKSAYYKLKLCYRQKNFLTTNAKIRICETYILSAFNYCDIVLQNMNEETKSRIQKIQNSCVRFIFNLRKYDHISEHFKSLDTLNMNNRRLLHGITLMHKIELKLAPEYLIERIIHNDDIHEHNTRKKNQIRSARPKTGYTSNSFFIHISREYNRIMEEINARINSTDESEIQRTVRISTFKVHSKIILKTRQSQ